MILLSYNNFLSWAHAWPTHSTKYVLIAVNGQTMSSAFHRVVTSVTTVFKWGGQNFSLLRYVSPDVACQKLLKSANVSHSYSKNNTGTVLLRHGVVHECDMLQVIVVINVYKRLLFFLTFVTSVLQARTIGDERNRHRRDITVLHRPMHSWKRRSQRRVRYSASLPRFPHL